MKRKRRSDSVIHRKICEKLRVYMQNKSSCLHRNEKGSRGERKKKRKEEEQRGERGEEREE